MKISTIYHYFNKAIRIALKFVLGAVCLLFVLVLYLFIFEIPSNETLRNPEIKEASLIYDVKGRLIDKYQQEYRIPIAAKEINVYIKQALLSVEDVRFYRHSGVDVKALFRVLFKTVILQEKESGGGSTLTQQLAKQLYKRPSLKNRNFFSRTFLLAKSKVKEWIIALKIESIYSKDEIMAMYLNKFEFINGAHGVESAALTYFGKNQKDLSIDEAATLVGMLKNPSLYNPIRFAKRTLERRNLVLNEMSRIHKVKIDSFLSKPLDMKNYQRNKSSEGPMPYFKNELAKWLTKLIKEKNIVKPDGTYYDIYGDALKIETTIDLDMQKYAEEASNEHMQWLQSWFFKMWKGKDPWTFAASPAEKEYRKQSLLQQAKSSLRYSALKEKTLKPIIQYFPSDLSITDEGISYLTSEDKDESMLINIDKENRKKYRVFKKSDAYAKVKPHLKALQTAFEKDFYTKTKMKVFDLKSGQIEIEMSPMDSVRFHAMHLQNAMVIMDPKSGQVKCWVGGLDYNYFKYDHVTPRRSVGSTMKPFLYTVAMMEKGMKPNQQYKDVEYSIEPGEGDFKNKERWTPHNATEVYTTLMYNMYHGLLYSKNSITVKILKEIGSIEPLRDLLDKVGLSKSATLPNGRLVIPQLPSVALGAIDIDLLQLTAAYATFANEGVYIEPIFIKSIKDKNGKLLYEPKQKKTRAIDPLYNSVMVDMLKNVVGGEFTMGLKSENAGKTGTTDNQSDGYFVGFTPSLIGGVWTGGDNKWIRFTNVDIGQGYFTARPAFEKFMKKLEKDTTGIYNYKLKFPNPPPGFKELTNCSKVKTEALPEFLRPKADNFKGIQIDSTKQDSVKTDTKMDSTSILLKK
jgi:penicillin-binding protein 1A